MEEKLLAVLLCVGGLGGFIFGYTTAVIAGALPLMEEDFSTLGDSTLLQGAVVSSILIGAVIGSAFGSSICSLLNKKRSIFVSGLIIIIGSLCSALSPYISLIILSRGVLGLGVGIITVACPLYVSEMSPERYSGALGSWFQIGLTFGILISYISALALSNVPFNYRWMFAAGLLPGLFLSLLVFVLPPTPSDDNSIITTDEKER